MKLTVSKVKGMTENADHGPNSERQKEAAALYERNEQRLEDLVARIGGGPLESVSVVRLEDSADQIITTALMGDGLDIVLIVSNGEHSERRTNHKSVVFGSVHPRFYGKYVPESFKESEADFSRDLDRLEKRLGFE